ncbi:MAG: choice-of-anchor B family protein, partial [Gammaproteobacteria bacterium]|nr:choice-of-anchor B family protein [Gammaproteobacteria bacterium]
MAAQEAAGQQTSAPMQAMAMTPCVGGFAGPYACDNVDLMAFMPMSSIGGGGGNDIWGWTDPQDGSEYAVMGRTTGTSFVDISDPENPVYLGNLPAHNGVSSSWRDIKVYANHAFIVSEAGGHGMQVFDLTELRSVVSPPVTFSETAHFAGFGSAHNIVINEDTGFAYGVGAGTCAGGLHFVNIQNPTSPVDAGCFSADGYTHDAQCIIYNGPDTTYTGSEICFNANEDSLTIVDVTDKGNPVQLSRRTYAGSVYAHQAWATEDHVYVLLGDELDEQGNGHNTRTYIWDVSDLNNNGGFMGFYDSAEPAIDHNLYIKGDYVYQSNYAAGLRILDITDISNANLFEEAFFDTYTPHNNPTFDGSWSNYPYFASGIVVVTSRGEGLFIVRPNLQADFNLGVTPPAGDVCAPSDAVYDIDLTALNGFSDTVTLSAYGHPTPPGSAVFSNNSMPVPYTSTLTVGTTGAIPGSYSIDVVGVAATSTHTSTVTLLVSDSAPAGTTLVAPANGATNVSTQPTFEWSAVAGAAQYYLEVATDPGFTNVVYSAAETGTSHTAASALNPATPHFWRVT